MPKRSQKGRKPFHLHHFLFPHKKNGYKPHVFRAASLTVIVLIVFALQVAYLAQVNLLFPKTGFLAAVLPGTLVGLTNQDRAANGVAPVTENTILDQAAQDAANDMAQNDYFAHISPTGKTPWYWLNLVGYQYAYAGQNLAVNFTDSQQVETAWMDSPTHRANIVKPEYTEIGVGVANGVYQGQEATFVVQYFASPAASGASGSSGSPSNAPASQQEPSVQTAPTESAGQGQIALAPTQTGVIASKQASAAPSASQVLGTETQPPSAAQAEKAPTGTMAFIDQIITSPLQAFLYILAALALIVAMLLLIEFIVKARLRYIEVTGGGLALLALLLVLIVFNIANAPQVQIGAQGAAAVAASGV